MLINIFASIGVVLGVAFLIQLLKQVIESTVSKVTCEHIEELEERIQKLEEHNDEN